MIHKLKQQFKIHKLGEYKKNDIQIFDKVTKEGDLILAINTSSNLMQASVGQTPSDSNPCTNVYKLMKELEEYLS